MEMWLEQMPPTALPLLPLLCIDLLRFLGYGSTRAPFSSIDGRYIARYAAYLDAYTGPGTATDSLGRYVPKVGTVSKVEQASTAASVSAFAATGFLYDGSPVYGS